MVFLEWISSSGPNSWTIDTSKLPVTPASRTGCSVSWSGKAASSALLSALKYRPYPHLRKVGWVGDRWVRVAAVRQAVVV